ncbi:hypothetical protein TWF694_008288 [Orbilia ellipsospora]|uniref:Uncharacterized protein n=1 Tax=Orbilia ellipsospora TaxID=2528407 RepID=A0AAV9XG97_9PEZI
MLNSPFVCFMVAVLLLSAPTICTPLTPARKEIKLGSRSIDGRQIPSAVDVSSTTLSHNFEECQLGLYQPTNLHFSGHNWEGRPLGIKNANSDTNQGCVNINDLSAPLSRAINSYALTGWCDCSFYTNENCQPQDFIFNAYNRQDTDLNEHGSNGNKIASYQCTFTNHTERFVSGTMMLGNGGTTLDGATYSINFKISQANFDLSESEPGSTDCETIDPPFFLERYSIVGVSCAAYTSKNCDESTRMITAGNAGTDAYDFGFDYATNDPAQRIKSWRCFLPFGIKWHPLPDQDPNA